MCTVRRFRQIARLLRFGKAIHTIKNVKAPMQTFVRGVCCGVLVKWRGASKCFRHWDKRKESSDILMYMNESCIHTLYRYSISHWPLFLPHLLRSNSQRICKPVVSLPKIEVVSFCLGRASKSFGCFSLVCMKLRELRGQVWSCHLPATASRFASAGTLFWSCLLLATSVYAWPCSCWAFLFIRETPRPCPCSEISQLPDLGWKSISPGEVILQHHCSTCLSEKTT